MRFILISILASASAFAQQQPAPQAKPFGIMPGGAPVSEVSVENLTGMRLRYMEFGATLTAVEVPDRDGKRANVILGLPSFDAYLASKRRFGTVGRFAGRIGGMRYRLDGKEVDLTKDGPPAPGFERRHWQRTDFRDTASAGSVFTLVSPAGDQGFPGTLTVQVTYRLMATANEFRIEYSATSDAPTVLNLTNHSYFNLAGAGAEGLRSHRFQIDADRYVATSDKTPTGELPLVAGTPLDFRQPRDLYGYMASGSPLLGSPPGYDHALVFSKPLGRFARVARIEDDASGRRMEVWTSEPSVQFFTGRSFDGVEPGAQGRPYRANDGFAFETQHLSDSPNHPQFPSTALYPGQRFTAVTSFRFSTDRPVSKARK